MRPASVAVRAFKAGARLVLPSLRVPLPRPVGVPADDDGGGGGGGERPATTPPAPATATTVARPAALVVASSVVMQAAAAAAGGPPGASLALATAPAAVGAALGAAYAAVDALAARTAWAVPATPLRVLITGGSRGLGRALAREFARAGDAVVLTSRSAPAARAVAAELAAELAAARPDRPPPSITGVACDVADPASVRRAVAAAVAALGGGVDCLVNNAGVGVPLRPLASTPPADLARVVATNLGGVAVVCATVLEVMAAQPGGGHVWNVDGAGAGGRAQPGLGAYGAAKAGVASLTRTLAAEVAAAGTPVGVHTLSPGMVLTPLLLDGAPPAVKATGFNWFAEQPEVAAAFLVPRARSAMAGRGARSTAVRVLTPWSAAARLLAAPFRRRRFFDADGTPLYPPSDTERLYGPSTAASAAREAGRAAARSRGLALSYATSMAAGFLLVAAGLLPDWWSGQ